MTKKFWIAALAGLLCIATLAIAQGPHHRGPGGPERVGRARGANFESLKTYLGLTDTQVAGLRQARTDGFDLAKPAMKENAQKARDLRAEMNKANPDSNTVGRLMTEMKQSREQNRSTQTQIRDKSMAILTEAQKAKLKALEDAASLQEAIREARMSGLLNAPAGSTGDSMMHGGRGFKH